MDSFSHIWRIDNFRHFLSQDESSVCSAPFTSEVNEHCTFQLELRHLAAAKQGPVSILLKTTNVHQIMVKLALLDNLGDSVNIHGLSCVAYFGLALILFCFRFRYKEKIYRK